MPSRDSSVSAPLAISSAGTETRFDDDKRTEDKLIPGPRLRIIENLKRIRIKISGSNVLRSEKYSLIFSFFSIQQMQIWRRFLLKIGKTWRLFYSLLYESVHLKSLISGGDPKGEGKVAKNSTQAIRTLPFSPSSSNPFYEHEPNRISYTKFEIWQQQMAPFQNGGNSKADSTSTKHIFGT